MRFLLLFKAELKRSFILLSRYPFQLITGIIASYITFMGVFYGFQGLKIFDNPSYSPGFLIIGFLIWQYAMVAVSDMPGEIMSESQTGTLEEILISVINPIHFLSARALADLLINTIWIIIFLSIISLTTGVFLHIPFFSTIIIFLFVIAGLYGFGFILAGLVIIFKQLGPIMGILNMIFLLFTGAIVPLDGFPNIIQCIAHTLPLTDGLKILRMIILEEKSLLYVIENGDMLRLTINSSIYLLLGVVVFKWCYKEARKRGVIGHY
jgi:ABC-2 type transport system permease protein